jgi:hypothetical protein
LDCKPVIAGVSWNSDGQRYVLSAFVEDDGKPSTTHDGGGSIITFTFDLPSHITGLHTLLIFAGIIGRDYRPSI